MPTYQPLSPAVSEFLSGLGLSIDLNHSEREGVIVLSQGPTDMGDEGGFELFVRRDLLENSQSRLGAFIAGEIYSAGVKAGEARLQKRIHEALGIV